MRHEPQTIGLALDSEGWADIAVLITGARQTGIELDEALIRAVIERSDKKRFSISEGGLRIRAVQGHSTGSVAIMYAEKLPPEFLYHGTAARFLRIDSQRRAETRREAVCEFVSRCTNSYRCWLALWQTCCANN